MASAPEQHIDDLTAENLTQHVIHTCIRNAPDDRTKTLISGLIQHMHDYVREVELRPGEWELGWEYLTKVKLSCTMPATFSDRASTGRPVLQLREAGNGPTI